MATSDTGDDSEYERIRKKENETLDTNIVHETAWDLFCSAAPPRHELYPIGCESADTIPVISKTLQQHGLRGLNTGDVIEIIGNEQSGKSQMLYQYALDCCLPSKVTVTVSTENGNPTVLELHGHNSRCILLDLLSSFNVDRFHDIFMKVLLRKIERHNKGIAASPALKRERQRAPPLHRHSMPLRLDQRNVAIHQQRIRSLKINGKRFEKSSECESLWKLVVSRMELVAPTTPIQLIVALHRFRRKLDDLYTAKLPDRHHDELDLHQLTDCDLDQIDGDGDDPELEQDGDPKLEAAMKEQRECTVRNLMIGGDRGMRLVLIDDVNAFFTELAASQQRDRWYNAFSSQLMALCAEYGLFVVFSRFTAFKKESEWLRHKLPLSDLRGAARRKTQSALKPEDSFHRKFGNFSLETKALFIVMVYRATMQCVDSTVAHPSITGNALFQPDGRSGDEMMEQNMQFILGDAATTRQWIQTLDVSQIDPLRFIMTEQQRANVQEYGVAEFNVVRGAAATTNEFVHRARRKKQRYDEDYEHAVAQKLVIRFSAKITGDGFVYNLN